MSEAQEELIVRHFKRASILLDGDEAGREGAKDCLVRLGRRMWSYAPVLPEGMQPDMLSAKDIQLHNLLLTTGICWGRETKRSASSCSLFRMLLNLVHEIGVAHDPEIKTPRVVYAGLPKVAGLVVLLGVERWVMQILKQEL
jgi:hypothetical protein